MNWWKERLKKGFFISFRIDWPEPKTKEDNVGLFKWIKGWFNKAKDIVKKMWVLAEPFLKELLGASKKALFDALRDLAVEAVQYVASQGLPTTEAKQEAFKAYMIGKAKDEVAELGASELNLLRETALAIYEKSINSK